MTFIVATKVVASQPPERRPTGTPHARANWRYKLNCEFTAVTGDASAKEDGVDYMENGNYGQHFIIWTRNIKELTRFRLKVFSLRWFWTQPSFREIVCLLK